MTTSTEPKQPSTQRAWHDRVCVVTGATSGIGLVTAAELAKLGARVVVVGRDAGRTKSAVEHVKREARHERVESRLCDFAKLSDVNALGADLARSLERLDVLVNNAGAHHATRQLTAEGVELTFAVNHLGYFVLTHALLDVLKRSAPSRIVNVASTLHHRGRIDFENLTLENRYSGLAAYSQSKLANVLFTRELARRLAGTGVTANAVHPGGVGTNIGQNNGGITSWFLRAIRPFLLTPEEGAKTSIYVATSKEIEGVSGKYFVKSRQTHVAPQAEDDVAAKRLWTVSEQLTGMAAP